MPDIDLLGLLQGKVGLLRSDLEKTEQRIEGLGIGVVTDIDDPEGLGRVRVKLPWLSDDLESAWAQIATPWAGSGRGSYFIPEVDDQVVVGFRHAQPKFPFILGFIWTDTARPPVPSPRLEKRGLQSKSGHQVMFDDTPAVQKVTIKSQGGHTIELDDTAGAMKVSITDSAGSHSIVVDTVSQKIAITSSTGNIELNASAGQLKIQAARVDIQASGTLSLQSGGTLSVKGTLVTIN